MHHDSLGRMESVSVLRLDDALQLRRLDVLKIDVESGEYDMLLGAERTIRRHQPLIYVEAGDDRCRLAYGSYRTCSTAGFRGK